MAGRTIEMFGQEDFSALEAVQERIGIFPQEEQAKIFDAWKLCGEGHAGQLRRDNSPYSRHPRGVALMMYYVGTQLDQNRPIEKRLPTSKLMQAAYIHDLAEDNIDILLLNPEDQLKPYEEQEPIAMQHIEDRFSKEVRDIFFSVTTPGWKNKRKAEAEGTLRLEEASAEALVLKMGDGDWNYATWLPKFDGHTPWKKIRYYEKVLKRIFKSVVKLAYPETYDFFTEQIDGSLIDLRKQYPLK